MALASSNSHCSSPCQPSHFLKEEPVLWCPFQPALNPRRTYVLASESAHLRPVRCFPKETCSVLSRRRPGLRPWTEQDSWQRLNCTAQDGQSPPDPSSRPLSSSNADSPQQLPTPSNRLAGRASDSTLASSAAGPGVGLAGEFCIIEGPDTLQDFARMQVQEIKDNIDSRRNRIFLLMEEIRRLRIQQRLKRLEESNSTTSLADDLEELPEYPSSIPFLPPLTRATLKEYYGAFAGLVFCIIMFGGLVAPTLEVKLGLGGTSYKEFIQSVGLPMQLSEVDPIVASFSGGAVGVLSALLVVEMNNVKNQEHKKCMYCHGSGYLTCARCSGSGAVQAPDSPSAGMASRCPNCAGSAKVMCPTCLCTGRALATEHDPRIDPFD